MPASVPVVEQLCVRRPLDSFILDGYVGFTAGLVAEWVSNSRLDRRLGILFLPLAVFLVAGFVRSGRAPVHRVLTTALVGGCGVAVPLLLMGASQVERRAGLVFAGAMLAGTALGVWVRSLVSRGRGLQAVAAGVAPLVASAAVVFGPGTRIVDQIYHPRIDRALPALALQTFSGAPIDTASWKGHVVVLTFWATWCGPCKEELPVLAEMQRAYKGNSHVIFIAADVGPGMSDTADKAQAYLQAHEPELSGAVWAGDVASFDKMRAEYKAGIPALFVIGNSRVRFAQSGFDTKGHFRAEVSNTVNDLLGE